MARLLGKDLSTLTLNAQSLKADTLSLTFKASAKLLETQTIGDNWVEYTAGLKGGDDISHELFYDNTTTTGTWAFLTNLLGGAAVALVIGDGTRTITANVIVKDVSLPIPIGDMVKVNATYSLSGAVVFS